MTVVYIDQWKRDVLPRSHWTTHDERVFDMFVSDGYEPEAAARKIEEGIADIVAAKSADDPLMYLARAAFQRALQESGRRR